MKLPLPIIEGELNLNKILTRIKEENSTNFIILDRKTVIGTLICKPKQNKLLEATATEHFTDGKVHCYKFTDKGTAKVYFDAFIEQDRIKKILG